MAEVQMGEMAQKQAEAPDVKAFGQRMVNDHGKDLEHLRQSANKKNLKLPDSPNHRQRSEAEKLSKLNGKSFDRQYVKYETKDHQEDIKDHSKEMKASSDTDLKQFATDVHSTVTEHYKIVQSLNSKLGK